MTLSFATVRARSDSWLAAYLPAILLFILTLGLRAYRLSADPLWLDEIYGFLLCQRGLAAILENSLYDPHPPLYYLFQWVVSGFGGYSNEWAWRWPSVLFGSLTIPLVYANASRITNRTSAFLGAVLLVISPAHLFYSQEARAFAFITFLAALSPLLIWEIHKTPHGKRAWIGLALLTVVGLYSSYSYFIIAAIQMAYLVVCFPKLRLLYLYLAIIIVSILPLTLPMLLSMSNTLQKNLDTQALTILRITQSLLAGEPVRYGLAWYHTWMPLILGICTVPGIWICLNKSAKGTVGLYFVIQLLLPPIVYSLGAGVANIQLPLSESKQFISLLPSLFIIVSAGLYFFQHRLPQFAFVSIAGVMIGLVATGSIMGIMRYWSITKSPEGLAAQHVMERVQDGDVVVSTHYSLDFALSFYYPKDNVYVGPRVVGDRMTFSGISVETTNPEDLPAESHQLDLESIRAYPRLWVLTRPHVTQSVDMQISTGCDRLDTWDFPPFQVELLANCSD